MGIMLEAASEWRQCTKQTQNGENERDIPAPVEAAPWIRVRGTMRGFEETGEAALSFSTKESRPSFCFSITVKSSKEPSSDPLKTTPTTQQT